MTPEGLVILLNHDDADNHKIIECSEVAAGYRDISVVLWAYFKHSLEQYHILLHYNVLELCMIQPFGK